MNHPGLDERLVVQYISRKYCGDRKAFAASNLVDPNTGVQNSEDFMNFMNLKGVISRRAMAAMSNKKSALDAENPGSINNAFFEEMANVLVSNSNTIFAPEGETNPWPSLKQLKTGIVRTALQYSKLHKRTIPLVPLGINFISTGSISRDIVIEIGEELTVNADDCKDEIYYVNDMTKKLNSSMIKLNNILQYSEVEPTAPYHNGRIRFDEICF